jgi:hypothetical protein
MYKVVYFLVAGLLLEYLVIHEAASRDERNKDMLERRVLVSMGVCSGVEGTRIIIIDLLMQLQ